MLFSVLSLYASTPTAELNILSLFMFLKWKKGSDTPCKPLAYLMTHKECQVPTPNNNSKGPECCPLQFPLAPHGVAILAF